MYENKPVQGIVYQINYRRSEFTKSGLKLKTDVYQGKTTLEYTIRDSVKIDI